jgi:hypothetical protein
MASPRRNIISASCLHSTKFFANLIQSLFLKIKVRKAKELETRLGFGCVPPYPRAVFFLPLDPVTGARDRREKIHVSSRADAGEWYELYPRWSSRIGGFAFCHDAVGVKLERETLGVRFDKYDLTDACRQDHPCTFMTRVRCREQDGAPHRNADPGGC